MAENVSLEPQEAQTAPETASRKDGKQYKTVKTIVTFSLLGLIILNLLISLLCYIGVPAGVTENGYVYQDTNIFTYMFDEDRGLLARLMYLIERMGSSSSSTAMNAMLSMYEVFGMLAGVLAVLIMSLITLIQTIIHSVKKDTEKLTIDLISVVGMNLTGILVIKLFTYESYDNLNYLVGGGMIASLVISLVALLAIAVLNFIFFREDIHKANKYKDILRSLSTCVCHLIAFAVLAAAAYYLCFYYLIGNMDALGNADSDVLLAILLQFVVFVLVIVVLARLKGAITNSLVYICTLSDVPNPKVKKSSFGFIGTFVMTFICFIALLIADKYAVVSFAYPLGACLVAVVGEVCYILFNKADFFKENNTDAVPSAAPATETAPVAESNAPATAPAEEPAPAAEPVKEDNTPSDNGAAK